MTHRTGAETVSFGTRAEFTFGAYMLRCGCDVRLAMPGARCDMTVSGVRVEVKAARLMKRLHHSDVYHWNMAPRWKRSELSAKKAACDIFALLACDDYAIRAVLFVPPADVPPYGSIRRTHETALAGGVGLYVPLVTEREHQALAHNGLTTHAVQLISLPDRLGDFEEMIKHGNQTFDRRSDQAA